MQPGRFLYPMDEAASQAVCEKWRAAPLMKKPLVEESQLTLTRDLVVIEDVSPEATSKHNLLGYPREPAREAPTDRT